MSKLNTRHIDTVLAVLDGRTGSGAADPVGQSWIRSAKDHGVDPLSQEAPRILTAREIRESQDAISPLIEAARLELDQLYNLVRPAHYVILLCDRQGLVIDHRGEERDAAQHRHWGVWLGGVWSEAVEGTNGIGTCLAEGRPLTVHRSQHFRARHINLSCSGAPLFGPDGELIGVLDVSSIDPGLSEHAHALTGALTIATARAIEERLFRKTFHRDWIVACSADSAPDSAMLIAVDRDRRIVGADRCARRALAPLGLERLDGAPGLWSMFERDEGLFRPADRGDVVARIRLRDWDESWPAIVTAPEPAAARWSQAAGDDLRLRPRLQNLALAAPAPDPARGGLAPAKLRRIREYVDAHLAQTIDLESLAATVGLSLHHFARAFKLSEGTPPHAYVLERRVARARELLTSTDLPLSAIALEVGFADQSHFARRFRETVGVPPGQFRRLQGYA